ncbi:ImmA/IrrE family metallo-endopeptidase [Roseovarius sp. TE539]|uniref:ImmA/IrrE family metallo-endopeptidase n=1 Tax=Roseovarius sp. TE539 TaxID=2249812 RepID=UPI00385793AA
MAHYVLHERKIGDGIFDDALYRSGLPHQEKVQANALAADILMPRDRVREMQRLHGDNINYLANLFWVSEQAMSIRLGVPT